MTQRTKWIVLAAGALVIIALVIFLGPQVSRLFTPPIPTPQCVQPTLTLGPAKFRIESIARAADGSVTVPKVVTDTAYWVDGTNVNYVFALSATPSNLALKDALKSGDDAKIVWADCTSDEYVVKSIETGQPANASLFDQSAGGITVFVQGDPSTASLVVKGARPQVQAPETPEPTEVGAVQAELSFLGNTTSPDGKSVQITVALTNTGTTPLSLTTNDISLTAENAAPLAPLSVKPSLPQEIKPGAGETLTITFPHPGVKTAVLKILTFSLDYYF